MAEAVEPHQAVITQVAVQVEAFPEQPVTANLQTVVVVVRKLPAVLPEVEAYVRVPPPEH